MNITTPTYDEMLRRLESVDSEPHLQPWREQFARTIAGKTTDAFGVVEVFAMTMNSANLPPLTQLILKANCRKYFEAFVDPVSIPDVIQICSARFGISL